MIFYMIAKMLGQNRKILYQFGKMAWHILPQGSGLKEDQSTRRLPAPKSAA
jgi:hypothetical protein